MAALLLLAACLLAQAAPGHALDIGNALSNAAGAVKSVFGGGGRGGSGSNGGGGSSGGMPQPTSIVARSKVALQYAMFPGGAAPGADPGSTVTLPFGGGANVTVHRSGAHSVVLAFATPTGLASGGGGGHGAAPVPFLRHFLAPAEGPAALVDAFGELMDEEQGTRGALADVRCVAGCRRAPAGLHAVHAAPAAAWPRRLLSSPPLAWTLP